MDRLTIYRAICIMITLSLVLIFIPQIYAAKPQIKYVKDIFVRYPYNLTRSFWLGIFMDVCSQKFCLRFRAGDCMLKGYNTYFLYVLDHKIYHEVMRYEGWEVHYVSYFAKPSIRPWVLKPYPKFANNSWYILQKDLIVATNGTYAIVIVRYINRGTKILTIEQWPTHIHEGTDVISGLIAVSVDWPKVKDITSKVNVYLNGQYLGVLNNLGIWNVYTPGILKFEYEGDVLYFTPINSCMTTPLIQYVSGREWIDIQAQTVSLKPGQNATYFFVISTKLISGTALRQLAEIAENIVRFVKPIPYHYVKHRLECDFNGNGRLDVGDVVLLLRILVGEYHSNVPCDLNHNGKLDIGDAVLLLKKLVGENVTHVIPSSKLKVVTIGFLLPLSGALSTEGILNKYVAELAIHDIDSWLKRADLPYRFRAAFYDTMTSYFGAIKAYDAAVSNGIRIIVGPMTSLELSAIYRRAEADRVVVVSQSSTAMSLHVVKPYVFRLAPPDMWQSKALATIIKDLGIKAVCIIYRVDPWGSTLEKYLEYFLKRLGIEYKSIGYPPTTSLYINYVRSLRNCVESFVSKYGYDHVAVEAITFDEIGCILKAASLFPILSKVLWLGCDGFTESPAIYKVCPIAVKVGLLSTIVGLPAQRMDWLKRRVLELYPNTTGILWEFASIEYDAVWIVALSVIKSYQDKGKLDTSYIDEILPKVAYLYSTGKPIPTSKGVLVGPWVTGTLWGKGALTGTIKLDEYHDRMGVYYDIYAVVPGNLTGCMWTLVATVNILTGKIFWYIKLPQITIR